MAEDTNKRVPFWRSLQAQFSLVVIVIFAAVLILLNIYPALVSQDLVFQAKQTSLLQDQASVIASTLAGPEALTAESVQLVMEKLGGTGDNRRVMVTDTMGLVLYDSGETAVATGQYALLREITSALHGQDVFHATFRDGAFRSRAAVPVVYRGMNIGAVCLYEYDAAQGELLLGIQSTLRSISIVTCVVAMVVIALFSRTFTRRMGDLLQAIRTVRAGEYRPREPLEGKDELALLAGEFNELTGRLQTTDEVRRRFVSDASHELKTPLASIRLLTDSILQSEEMNAATTREFVSDIGEEAERLTRITEKLLALTRMDSGGGLERTPVSIAPVVERVRHMLLPLAQAEGIQIHTALIPDAVVYATEDDLYQIIFNLIENAIKYNFPGGAVFVMLERKGGMVTLRVEDTGVGIPEDELTKVFDRFYRVDKARSRAAGGTGLGLSIVSDTANRHGGIVTARRREPEGTCFEVVFQAYLPGEEKTQ